MDVQTIDRAYGQLQSEAQQTAQKVEALVAKMQTAAQSGDANAREWLLDLREVTIAIRDEESQVGSLLQAMHAFAVTTLQSPPVQQYQEPPQPYPQQPPQQYGGQYPPPQQPYGQPPYQGGYGQQQPGGMLGGFLNSGFGRAVEMGLGFGVGDDLINRIF